MSSEQHKSVFYARLCELCKEKHIAPTAFLETELKMSKGNLSKWQNGKAPRSDTVQKIADYFDVSTDYLLGNSVTKTNTVAKWLAENSIPVSGLVKLPVYGVVRAGVGGLAEQDIIGYESVDIQVVASGEEYFWLKVSGDSMSPRIEDGDFVLVKRQSMVDSGQIAVVTIDGEEGVLKKVELEPDSITLVSFNPYYPPRKFEKEDMNRVEIMGLAVETKRKL